MSNFKTRVTIYEVAKSAGVSLATVSRVINKKDNVTEETRIKVMGTIERLGYKPSALAQGLAKSKSTNIGIVLPSKNYVYISNVLSGLTDIAKIYGYQTSLFTTRQNREEVKDTIERLITSHVDGAILFDDALLEEDILELSKYKIPVVVIGHDVVADDIASIIINYADEIKNFIRNYFENNDNPVYFLHLDNAGILVNDLEEVVREEVNKLGKGDKFNLLPILDSYDKDCETLQLFFETHKKGLFISPRDSISCAIVNAALDNGLSIPDDIQALSVIGTKYSRIMRPTLSSLSVDMYEVGSIAMRMLTKMLEGTLKNKTFKFVAKYTKRQSTNN